MAWGGGAGALGGAGMGGVRGMGLRGVGKWVGLLGCVDGGLGRVGGAEVWGGWELDTLYHGGGGAGVLGCWGGGGV